MDVAILADDRHYFPPYECAVWRGRRRSRIIRNCGPPWRSFPEKCPNEVMRKLNYEVDGKHRSVVEVARKFLQSY